MKESDRVPGEKKNSHAAIGITIAIFLCLLLVGGVFVVSGHFPLSNDEGPVERSSVPEDSSDSFADRTYDWLGIDTVLSILNPEKTVIGKERDVLTVSSGSGSDSKETADGSSTTVQDASESTAAEDKEPIGTMTAQAASDGAAAETKDNAKAQDASKDAAGENKETETAKAPAENKDEKAAQSAPEDAAGDNKAIERAQGTSKDAATENKEGTAAKASAENKEGAAAKASAEDTAEKKEGQKDTSSKKSPTKLQKKYIKAWEDWHMRSFPLNFPLHNYNWKYLEYDEKGILHYEGDENYSIRRGIDVSEFQGKIDWKKVKEAGYDFVFVRVGHRTMHTGDLQRDSRAIKNLRRAAEAGLDVGAYLFSQAVTKDEAREEAKLCLEVIEESGVKLTLPIVYDPEIVVEDYYARINYISGEQFTDNAVAFCEKIRKAGYTPAVYANCSTETDILDMSRLKDTIIWYADYSGTPESPYDFTFWQYSNLGWVEGIPETETDLNVWFIKKE